MAEKALIAMSGGVDSSVAALLMKEQGYDCIGVTMKLFAPDMVLPTGSCLTDNTEDASKVAEILGIPYQVVNYEADFKSRVMDTFVQAYLKGWTPNPCIECNRYLKFAHLYRTAQEMGCNLIVTGHYARIQVMQGEYSLHTAVDKTKDQSYVLYSIPGEQLAHVRFPLGELTKEKVRQIAEDHGFVNANRKDSQDICFIPDGDYRKFMEEVYQVKIDAGDFVDKEGKVLGRHKGYHAYTIGQRKGLGIAAEKPYYVVDIRPQTNQVVLGANEDLFSCTLLAEDMNWMTDLTGEADADGMISHVQAKVRYRHQAQEAKVNILPDGKAKLIFDDPQRAITKGQAVVLYRDDRVLGGGTITAVL